MGERQRRFAYLLSLPSGTQKAGFPGMRPCVRQCASREHVSGRFENSLWFQRELMHVVVPKGVSHAQVKMPYIRVDRKNV